MNLLLTSFHRSLALPPSYVRLSIARWQPRGLHYPKVQAFASNLRIRAYGGDLDRFAQAVLQLFESRQAEVERWLGSLDPAANYALCCWCPYSSVSTKQIKLFGTFVCHGMVLVPYLARFGVNVDLDLDRRNNAVPLLAQPPLVSRGDGRRPEEAGDTYAL